jgi:hypothetical protein
MADADFEMVFHVQLAHGSPTKQVKDFTNVKQLYEAIAKAFGIATSDILYCTLNTHKVQMERLLGGQIGLDDFLFAHVADTGKKRLAKINKSGPALGLTISDNGAGYSFIKKIRDGSLVAQCPDVKVGDHIASINGQSLVGTRHFEVAKMLKNVPVGSEFTMEVIHPILGMGVSERSAMGGTSVGSGKKTVRMKKDGSIEVETVNDAVEELVGKVDTMMEAHIGIRDSELSRTIYDLAKKHAEADEFAEALDEKLGDFEFPDDFVLDAHEMINK